MFSLPTQRDRQNLLHEYMPTNYSVVNNRTIDSVRHLLIVIGPTLTMVPSSCTK